MDDRFAIPDAVRARDLVGYGRTPPRFEWPDGARVVVNLVLVYEEGSEYSVMWGDDRPLEPRRGSAVADQVARAHRVGYGEPVVHWGRV